MTTARPLCPTLSLMVTYQCNIECRHCGPLCGPRDREWMTTAEMEDLISQAAALGAHNVVFTGGEPTLLGPRLNALLQHAKQTARVPSCRLVTNAAWAKTYDRARELLAEWQESGLDELNVSCGEFHQEFVPLSNIVNAYRAACDLGYKTVLLIAEMVEEGKGQLARRDFTEAFGEQLRQVADMSPFSAFRHGLDFSPALPYGRGETAIDRSTLMYVDYAAVGNTCSDVLTSITVHPNGNVTACCGIMCREESMLNIGNWRQSRLKDIVQNADGDLVLNWIKYVGLKDMRQWLTERDPALGLRTEYQNICDLCADVLRNDKCRAHLAAGGHEREADIVANRVAHEAVFYGPPIRYQKAADVPADIPA